MIHPKVFRVTYEDDYHHRKSTCGGMDSEYSHTTREKMEEYVIAPDLDTAKFLWTHRSAAINSRTNIAWEELGNVSLMMTDKPVFGL